MRKKYHEKWERNINMKIEKEIPREVRKKYKYENWERNTKKSEKEILIWKLRKKYKEKWERNINMELKVIQIDL